MFSVGQKSPTGFCLQMGKRSKRVGLYRTIQKENQKPQKDPIETEGREAVLFYVGKEGADHDQRGEKSGGGA